MLSGYVNIPKSIIDFIESGNSGNVLPGSFSEMKRLASMNKPFLFKVYTGDVHLSGVATVVESDSEIALNAIVNLPPAAAIAIRIKSSDIVLYEMVIV